jgi:hypothetical protein
MNNNKLKKPSPLKFWIQAAGLAYSMWQSNKRNKLAQQALRDAEIEEEKEKALLEKEMGRYKSMKFENPYAENVYEDLTISKESAEFQMEQAAQQRANIMAGLSGAAGTSGLSGLAQQLVAQGTLQSRQVSADIAKQEAMNQQLAARGAQQKQQGEDWVQQMEIQRKQDLLMSRLGGSAGAMAARQQAESNVINARLSGQGQVGGSFTDLAENVTEEDWSKFGDTLGKGWGSLKTWGQNLFNNPNSARNIGWGDNPTGTNLG